MEGERILLTDPTLGSSVLNYCCAAAARIPCDEYAARDLLGASSSLYPLYIGDSL